MLASLREGFGRVYLEALMNGLPVVAHRNEVTEFVLGEEGYLIDLLQVGGSEKLPQLLRQSSTVEEHGVDGFQYVTDLVGKHCGRSIATCSSVVPINRVVRKLWLKPIFYC